MSVLSKDEILKCMKEGTIKIEPFDEKNLGPASYDCSLSNEVRYYKAGSGVVDVENDSDYKKYTIIYVCDDPKFGIVLPPNSAMLGITNEKITLSPQYCGLLEGRSRFARLGLFVHISASFMQPGISNKQVLEIYNASPNPLRLIPGTKICQFIFLKMLGEGKYEGKFAKQDL